jgi:hypothetical protein
MKVDPVSANYYVDYRKIDNVWQLNHVQSEVKFKCKWNKKLFKSTYTVMSEMAITDRDTTNIEKFRLRESVRLNDILSEKLSAFKDEEFWGDYNIIKPEESIESAISKLNKRLIRRQERD